MSRCISEHKQQLYNAQQIILIVEDDASIGLFLSLTFSEETAYKSILAPSAERALSVLETITPTLLIIDYQLPVMNGIQLCHEIRKRKDLMRIPIIMLSANLPVGEIEKLKITGMDKPFDLDDLLGTVDFLIEAANC